MSKTVQSKNRAVSVRQQDQLLTVIQDGKSPTSVQLDAMFVAAAVSNSGELLAVVTYNHAARLMMYALKFGMWNAVATFELPKTATDSLPNLEWLEADDDASKIPDLQMRCRNGCQKYTHAPDNTWQLVPPA